MSFKKKKKKKKKKIVPRSMGGISQVYPRSIATCSSEPLRPGRPTKRSCT